MDERHGQRSTQAEGNGLSARLSVTASWSKVMKFIAGASAIWLVLSAGALFGCSRSVQVDKIRSDPTIPSGSTSSTLPGFPTDPYVSPTLLGNVQCAEEASSSIIVYGGDPGDSGTPPPPQIGRFPTSGNSFVAFWTICNAGKVAVPAGTSYVFSIQNQQVDSRSPTSPPTLTAFKNVTLNVPALASCACFVQEVGINMAVPATAAQQQAIQGQNVAFATQFPTQTVPAEPPPSGPLSFEYVASLPTQFGVAVLAFQVN